MPPLRAERDIAFGGQRFFKAQQVCSTRGSTETLAAQESSVAAPESSSARVRQRLHRRGRHWRDGCTCRRCCRCVGHAAEPRHVWRPAQRPTREGVPSNRSSQRARAPSPTADGYSRKHVDTLPAATVAVAPPQYASQQQEQFQQPRQFAELPPTQQKYQQPTQQELQQPYQQPQPTHKPQRLYRQHVTS